jgi:hypothetical protein
MKTHPIRSLPAEIAAKIRLEPTLVNYYVEGRNDVQILAPLVRGLCGRARVLEIDQVDLPACELFAAGLDDSKRCRLLYLANYLSQHLVPAVAGIACIVDLDFDELLDLQRPSEYLVVLQRIGIESYYAEHSIVSKALHAIDSTLPFTVGLWDSMVDCLVQLFLLRAANVMQNWCMAWLPPTACPNLTEGNVTLESATFRTRYLSKNARLASEAEFVDALDKIRVRAEQIPRSRLIRGHDFVQILRWYVAQSGGSRLARQYSDDDVFFSLLKAAADNDHLLGYPEIRALLQHGGSGKDPGPSGAKPRAPLK